MEHRTTLFCGIWTLLLPGAVLAQESEVLPPASEVRYQEAARGPQHGGMFDSGERDPNQPKLLVPGGMSATLGGGIRGFTEDAGQETVDSFGVWEGRIVLGTRRTLGLEAGYSGAIGDIDTLGLDQNARLLSNAVEGALRLHLLAGMWQPYLLAGAGWQRYTITSEDSNTSSLADEDDMAVFPLGVGLAMRYEGLLVDARGVYRPTYGADLIPEAGSDLSTWTAALSAGAEF